MLANVLNLLLTTVMIRPTWCEMSDLHICHDDFSLSPSDGTLEGRTFPWLGFIQHIHEVTGLQHPDRAARVLLVHKQFILSLARDLLNLPKAYKLGHVIFTDYEPEEKDCGLTIRNILMGYKCPPASLDIPLEYILPHPEFARFGMNNSLALAKLLHPMKSFSGYMVPVCLPTVTERMKLKRNNTVWLIDYINSVPRDITVEQLAKRTLKVYAQDMCLRTQTQKTIGQSLSQFFCTTGCGMRPGAPIVAHAIDGRFELLGLAVGGPPCADGIMRRRFNKDPPFYIDVYPYVSWISNILAAHVLPKPYPQRFQLVRGAYQLGTVRSSEKTTAGWKGRTYLFGKRCFISAKKRQQDVFFYRDTFHFRADLLKIPSAINITLKISTGPGCIISCVRLLLPHRQYVPKITVQGVHLILRMEAVMIKESYAFSLGITGRNVTQITHQDQFSNRRITLK